MIFIYFTKSISRKLSLKSVIVVQINHGTADRYQQVAEELKATNEELEKKIEFHVGHESELIADKEAADGDVLRMKRDVKKAAQEIQAHSKRRDKADSEKEKMRR